MNSQPTITRVVKEEARAPSAMVATKDREATRAGLRMLAQGGNASGRRGSIMSSP